MTRAQAQEKIAAMVAGIRRRWLGRQLGIAAGGLAGLALVWSLAMIAADNFVILGSAQLLAGWVVLGLATLLWLALAGLSMTVRRPSASRFALMYEGRTAGQQNRLINALQFMLEGQAADPMACAAVLENAESVDPRTAGAAIDRRPLLKVLAAAGVGALALAAYAGARPALARNAWQRLLQPAAPPPHLLTTDIRVEPGDRRVLDGSAVPIDVRLARNLPPRVTLEYRLGEMAWTQVEMTKLGPDRFRYDGFEAVNIPLRYRIHAGRSRSRVFQLEVQFRPRLESLQAIVVEPSYVGGKEQVLAPNVGDLTGLTGSHVKLRFVANNPLARAELVLGGAATPATIDAQDSRRGTASFTLTRNSSYVIRLTDAAKVTEQSEPYTVTAVSDAPPAALITLPGRDLILPVDSLLQLKLEARDDIGLGEVRLQVRPAKGKWRDEKEWTFDAPDVRQRGLQATLGLKRFGVKVDQVLLYRVMAFDRRQPQPNKTVGRTWSITVAEADGEESLLAKERQRLLETLERLLHLQRENRAAMDRKTKVQAIHDKQVKIRDLTLAAIEEQQQAVRPSPLVISELTHLAGAPMLYTSQILQRFQITGDPRLGKLIVAKMDYIIKRLEELIRKTRGALEAGAKEEEALAKLTRQERAALMKKIRDEVKRLKDFIADQDKVIEKVEELARKADDFTPEDLQKLERLKGTEDKWAAILRGKVKDIELLAKQDFSNDHMADDYKEIVEHIEEASKNISKDVNIAKSGAMGPIKGDTEEQEEARKKARNVLEEMEVWAQHQNDATKYLMDNPPEQLEAPNVTMPDELFDLVGELIEEQDAVADAADDPTSGNIAKGGGGEDVPPNTKIQGGPISVFGGLGKTGNQMPDSNKASGTAGDGRAGPSQGQALESVAKGLPGRKSTTDITNDPYEEGVIKELQQLATGGATGGGKGRGSGQEGLEGESAPPLFDGLKEMKDWQQRARQKSRRVATELKTLSIHLPQYDEVLSLMREAEKTGGEGRYQEGFKTRRMVVNKLEHADKLEARAASMRVDPAAAGPGKERAKVLDAIDEAVPSEYQEAVRRYFEKLSDSQ